VKPGRGPLADLWWLVSRASGIVALVLISLSVLMGLAMAAKVLRAPKAKRLVVTLHEHVALTALLAIAVHGAALLGDRWLKPGLSGITVPFALGYRPQFTGPGIIAGYLALLLGPSFYLRRRIGARRWRRLHSLIGLTWVLSVVHTLGAGSDARQLWLRALVALPAIPMAYLLTLRLLRPAPAVAAARARAETSPASNVISLRPGLRASDHDANHGASRNGGYLSVTRMKA